MKFISEVINQCYKNRVKERMKLEHHSETMTLTNYVLHTGKNDLFGMPIIIYGVNK
jgi:hypothetical protein